LSLLGAKTVVNIFARRLGVVCILSLLAVCTCASDSRPHARQTNYYRRMPHDASPELRN